MLFFFLGDSKHICDVVSKEHFPPEPDWHFTHRVIFTFEDTQTCWHRTSVKAQCLIKLLVHQPVESISCSSLNEPFRCVSSLWSLTQQYVQLFDLKDIFNAKSEAHYYSLNATLLSFTVIPEQRKHVSLIICYSWLTSDFSENSSVLTLIPHSCSKRWSKEYPQRRKSLNTSTSWCWVMTGGLSHLLSTVTEIMRK